MGLSLREVVYKGKSQKQDHRYVNHKRDYRSHERWLIRLVLGLLVGFALVLDDLENSDKRGDKKAKWKEKSPKGAKCRFTVDLAGTQFK